MKEEVGYEEFLATVYEAKTEGTEGKILSAKAKAMTVEKIVDKDEPTNLRHKATDKIVGHNYEKYYSGKCKNERWRRGIISEKEGGISRFPKESISRIT